MLRIPDASARNLHSFIFRDIAPGSSIVKDVWEGCTGLKAHGYSPEVRIARGSKDRVTQFLPRDHRVTSLLKHWILGTQQGAISANHLDYYLDEFTFRFNRRNSQNPVKIFYHLL